MERSTKRPVRILAGLILTSASVFAQAYTISAKPGVVNYIEGTASLNGTRVADRNLQALFLYANDTLATENGKAEVLLTPGVFLRVGENSEIRMISPSLVDTKVEILRGEIMIEAAGLLKDNNLQILDHGALITISKNGLYRFTADNPPTVAVLDGKADVQYSDRMLNLKKGHETVLASNLSIEKFDTKREDDLYAWSNVRSEYDAASSYGIAREASLSSFDSGYNYGGYSGLGYGSAFGPGWFWNSGFNSYAWLPGNGIFYSPFGYGFYSPGRVGYASVVNTYVYRGGRPWRTPNGTPPATTGGVTAAVPVSMKNPPAVGGVTSSPFANHEARMQTARAFAAANGGNGFAGSGNWHSGSAASGRPNVSGSPASSHANTGAGAGGGFSGGGGGHATGGGGFGGSGGGHASGGGSHGK